MLDAIRTLFAPEHSKTLAILGYLVFLSLVFYLLIGEVTSTRADYFSELAQSFLHGRLYIETKPDYLDELVGQNGKYYVVYPPLPAVVEMPFVAIFSNFSQPFLSTLIGVTDVLLGFLVMQKIFKNEALSLWMGYSMPSAACSGFIAELVALGISLIF